MSAPWYVAIIVAIIAGVAGIATSTVNYVFNKRTQHQQLDFNERTQIEQLNLKAELDDLAGEEGAWRSYWFEARKRLYADVRPLLFQIAEYSYIGRDRIVRILKNEITVHDKVGNTALRIFAPLVSGRELQRRLTNVDLTLDKTVSAQYGVIREMLTNLEHYSKPHVIEKKKSPLAASNASR